METGLAERTQQDEKRDDRKNAVIVKPIETTAEQGRGVNGRRLGYGSPLPPMYFALAAGSMVPRILDALELREPACSICFSRSL
jgi:hypothetical protein